MNLLSVTMKYSRLVVFIRHDSVEIWGFRYGLTLVIGTLKTMASTGVFVRVVRVLKHSTKNYPSPSSTNCPKQSHGRQKMGPGRDFQEGRQLTKQTELQPRKVVDFIKLNI